ncbi:MAG: hypothetical protein R3B96_06815 [Pirellulaceae bacterium]
MPQRFAPSRTPSELRWIVVLMLAVAGLSAGAIVAARSSCAQEATSAPVDLDELWPNQLPGFVDRYHRLSRRG